MESKRKSEGGPAKIWRQKYSAGITNGEGSVVVLGYLRFRNRETDRNLFFVVFVCLIFRFSFPLTLPFSPEPSSDFGEPKLCQMGRAKNDEKLRAVKKCLRIKWDTNFTGNSFQGRFKRSWVIFGTFQQLQSNRNFGSGVGFGKMCDREIADFKINANR